MIIIVILFITISIKSYNVTIVTIVRIILFVTMYTNLLLSPIFCSISSVIRPLDAIFLNQPRSDGFYARVV